MNFFLERLMQNDSEQLQKMRESVDMSHRGLRVFENLLVSEHVVELNLSDNCITSLKGISTLRSLKVLDVSFNWLDSLDGLEGMFALTDLCVSNNNIMSLIGLSSLGDPSCSLQSLDVSHNPVTSSLDSFTQMESLVCLLGLKRINKLTAGFAVIGQLEVTQILPNLSSLDGVSVSEIVEHDPTISIGLFERLRLIQAICSNADAAMTEMHSQMYLESAKHARAVAEIKDQLKTANAETTRVRSDIETDLLSLDSKLSALVEENYYLRTGQQSNTQLKVDLSETRSMVSALQEQRTNLISEQHSLEANITSLQQRTIFLEKSLSDSQIACGESAKALIQARQEFDRFIETIDRSVADQSQKHRELVEALEAQLQQALADREKAVVELRDVRVMMDRIQDGHLQAVTELSGQKDMLSIEKAALELAINESRRKHEVNETKLRERLEQKILSLQAELSSRAISLSDLGALVTEQQRLLDRRDADLVLVKDSCRREMDRKIQEVSEEVSAQYAAELSKVKLELNEAVGLLHKVDSRYSVVATERDSLKQQLDKLQCELRNSGEKYETKIDKLQQIINQLVSV